MSVRRSPIRRRSRCVALLGLVAAISAALLAGPTGSANAGLLNASFSCRASVANLLGLEPIVANRPGIPCRSEDKAVLFQKFSNPSNPSQFVQVEVAHAKTESFLDRATAHAEAAKVIATDGTNQLRVEGARADAEVACRLVGFHPAPQFRGSSTVATVTLGPQQISVPQNNAHQDIPLGQLGTIHLNEQERFAVNGRQFLRVRAVWWDRPAPELDIIVGEAIVDVAACS